jgi:hypothetical protein
MKRKAHLVLPYFIESHRCNTVRRADNQVTVVPCFGNVLWHLGKGLGETK